MAQTIRPVPAVKRAIQVLEYLAKSDEPQSLSQIARAVDILPSSCLHILRELTAGRLLRFEDERKVYSLGWGILNLARGLDTRDSFAELAQPHVSRIANAHHAVATASVFDGRSSILVVVSSDVTDHAPIHLPVGMRVPFLASATGRVLAAFNSFAEDQLRAAFADLSWQRPLTFRRWKQDIAAVRINGYAVDEGMYRRGITVVAAPVYDGDRVEKFIGASMLSEQVSGDALRELAEDVKSAALEVSREIRGDS